MKKTPKFSFWEPQDRGGLMIAGLYILVGGLWILFSDRLAALITSNREAFTTLSIYKGWAYVLVTGFMLYLLIQRNHRILRKSEARFHSAFDNMLESAQIIDHDWRYVYLNETAERYNHRPNRELLGKKFTEVWPGIEETPVFAAIKSCMEQQVASQLEDRFVYPDGSSNWFTLRIQSVPEGVFILSIDVTERKQAETKVTQLTRLYATLSQVNQTIVRTKDRDDLYRSICELAVQFGGFSLAWIGLLDESSGDILPIAAQGLDIKKWPFPTINIYHGAFKDGLVAKALHTAEVITSENLQTDERTRNLHTQFQEMGYKSSAAVPIQFLGQPMGVLILISSEVGLFKQEDEVFLLNEIGLDISFALEKMETERVKQQWADAFENCAHGMAIGLPAANQILTCNPAFARLQGRTVEEVSSMPILSQYAPQDHEHVKNCIAEADRTGNVRFEAHMIRKDGRIYPVQMDVVSVLDKYGNPIYRVATQQDVSERKQAEEKLLESERTLQLFLEYAPAAIAMFDRDMRYIAASHRYFTDYRLPNQDIVGRTHYEVFPEIPERWKEIHQRCLAGASDHAEEDPFPRADGSLDWVRWEIHPWYKSGEIGGIILFSEVITDRKVSQEKLRESEERFRSLYENATIGIYRTTPDGHILLANPALVSLLGYRSLEELAQRNLNENGYESGYERNIFLEKIESDGMVTGLESAWKKKDRTTVFVRESARAIYNAQGNIAYYEGTVEDISERKLAEEALRKSETRFRSLVENSSDEISIINAEGNLVYESPSANSTLGFEPGKFLGQNIFQLVHPDDLEHVQAQFARLMQDPGFHPREQFRLLHQTGDWRWVEAVGTNLLAEPSVGGIVINYHDITERKQAEEALRQSEERHRLISNLISDYVYSGAIFPDGTSRTEWVSGAFERITGYTLEEINQLPAGFATLVLPEDMEKVMGQLSVLFEKGSLDIEYRIRRRDGEIRWMRDYMDYAAGEGPGKTARMIGAVQDITERVQAEKTLRMSENRFQLASKATNDVIWEWNANTHKLIWSENARVVFGYAPDQMGNDEKWWDERIHPEDRDRIVSKMNALIAGRESNWSDEYRFRRQDGSYCYVSDRGYIEREADGKAIRMVGAMSDITERKQAEQQVKRQLRRVRALSTIDRAITSSLDMRLSLDILLSELLSQLEVDAASVLLLDSYSHSLEFVAGKGFRTSKIRNSRVHLGDAGAGQVGLERKVLHVADLTTVGAQFKRADLIKEDGFVEYYAVPLVAKGQLKGVLETFHRSHLDLDLEWVNYLETLGGQAAIAIDNAQLFEGMQRSHIELITAYDATIAGWSHAMDLRDKETEGHTQRVTDLTLQLAEKMGVSQQEQVHIRRGALLHDIGKLGVPDHILLKPGALTEEEWAIMRQHPNYAFEMLMPIAYLQPALDIPYCHHEKWDGTGYPRRLKGDQIPLAARIFAVVDVWDALRSDRPYRAAWSEKKTKEHIRSLAGTHFDPQVAEIFLKLLEE